MSRSNFTSIVPLPDARRNRKTGAKASNLSELTAARFDVPRGFVISADAYCYHLWASGAKELASAWADSGNEEEIRRAVLSAEIPEDTWQPIAQAYERLALQLGVPEPKVSVRPSAIEDGVPVGRLPGAYEACLDVSGLDALKDALKHVWASTWSEQACESRREAAAKGEPAMAVIIQQMVCAERSGKAVTADPDTGNPQRVVIWHGEGSGRYCVDLADLSIVEWPEDDPQLTSSDVHRICDQAVLVEDVLPGRVEIEWALEGDRLWVLQADPAYALPHYFPSDSVSQSGAKPHYRRASRRPMSYFARDRIRKSDALCIVNGFLYETVDEPEGDGAVVDRPSETKITSGVPGALSSWKTAIEPELRTIGKRVIECNVKRLEYRDLLKALSDSAEAAEVAVEWAGRMRWLCHSTIQMLSAALRQRTQDESLCMRLLGGAEDTIVARDARLQDLGARVFVAQQSEKLNDEKWRRNFRADANAFVRDYGYSFADTGELHDISAWKSWVEDMETVFRIINAASRQGNRPTILTLHGAAEQDAEAAAAEAAAVFRGASRRRFNGLLRLARKLLAAQSQAEHVCGLTCTALRLAVAEMGVRLRRCGLLAEADDAFQLILEEMLAIPEEPDESLRAEMGALVAKRKHKLWLEARFAAPSALPVPAGEAQPAPERSQMRGGTFRGCAVGPGTATGRARVAADVESAGEIEKGDILVVRAPRLVWTPFLSTAGALVTEDGCNCCGESLLAREYGIPVVTSCRGIFAAVTQGQRVTVSGSEGVVELQGAAES